MSLKPQQIAAIQRAKSKKEIEDLQLKLRLAKASYERALSALRRPSPKCADHIEKDEKRIYNEYFPTIGAR